MHAYRATGSDGDGFINKPEFGRFLHHLVYFTDLWQHFGSSDSIERILSKLQKYLGTSGRHQKFDGNGGGFVLFDEFCVWCAHQHYGAGFGISDEVAIDKIAHLNVPKLVHRGEPRAMTHRGLDAV